MTRTEALSTLKENICHSCAYGAENMDACDISYCDNREAIQTLERKKGYWDKYIDFGNVGHDICSVCHEEGLGTKFCPHCGADMRESEDT